MVIKVTDVTKPKDPSIPVVAQAQTAHDLNSKPKSSEIVNTQNNKIPENKNSNYYKRIFNE